MVSIDLTKAVNESVDEGLKKAGVPNTPERRIEVLNGMHRSLVAEEPSGQSTRPILTAIEDEVIRLNEELLS